MATVESDEEVDYYNVLNVSRDAEEQDIRASYKKLCRTFHPDRHQNEVDQQHAHMKFQEITTAYEVLNDSSKRFIYDKYGVGGLATGWELSKKHKTPEELRVEMDRMLHRRDVEDLESKVGARGTVRMAMQATDLYDSYTKRWSWPDITGIDVSQQFQMKLGNKDVLTVGGATSSQRGEGSGQMFASLNHTFSNTSLGMVQLNTSDEIANLTVALHRISSERSGDVSLNLNRHGAGIELCTDQQVGMGVNGRLALALGQRSHVKLGLRRNTESVHCGTTLKIDPAHVALVTKMSAKLSKKSSISISGTIGTERLAVSVGTTRRVSTHSRLGMTVHVGSDGLTLELSLSRIGQNIEVPILLTRELSAPIVAGALIVTPLVILIAKFGIIDPSRRYRKRQKIAAKRRTNAQDSEMYRRKAEADIRLMQATVDRNREKEEKRRGLVIIGARYGNFDESADPPLYIDVTGPIQYLVEDSKLRISSATTKESLLGFYDPCAGENKQIEINYLFRDMIHYVIVSEDEDINLPVQSHLCTSG